MCRLLATIGVCGLSQRIDVPDVPTASLSMSGGVIPVDSLAWKDHAVTEVCPRRFVKVGLVRLAVRV